MFPLSVAAFGRISGGYHESKKVEDKQIAYLPIVSADIHADISADRYLQNFVLSAFLPMGSLSADIPLYRQIWLLSADKSLISETWYH